MKRSILLASLASVLTLGLAGAQGWVAPVGSVLTSPVQLSEGEDGFTAKAGAVTYVQIAQDRLSAVGEDGIAHATSDASDRFAIESASVPEGWGVALAAAQVKNEYDGWGEQLYDGSTPMTYAQNTYAVSVPAGTPAGTYTLQITVRNIENDEAYTFPLEVTVE